MLYQVEFVADGMLKTVSFSDETEAFLFASKVDGAVLSGWVYND